MPARSTLLQKVTYLLQRAIVPNCIVEESATLVNQLTGVSMETDILITHTNGPYKYLTAIEVVERSRKADVNWVRTQSGRYRDIPVNKLILVSGLGFTRDARHEAEQLGFTAVSLEEAERLDWSNTISTLNTLWIAKYELTLEGSGSYLILHDASRVDNLHPDLDICHADGTVRTSLSLLGLHALQNIPNSFKEELFNQSKQFIVVKANNSSFCLRRASGELDPVAEFHFKVRASESPRSAIEVRRASLLGSNIAYGAAQTEFGDTTLLVVENGHESKILIDTDLDGFGMATPMQLTPTISEDLADNPR
jgi:hypothetical protein